MEINGEGIFSTRAWKVCGEGSNYEANVEEEPEATKWEPAHVDENEIDWKTDDIRFTSKKDTIYAFLMRWPGELAIVHSLPLGQEPVEGVELLGCGKLHFRQTAAGLMIDLPKEKAADLSCLKISLRP